MSAKYQKSMKHVKIVKLLRPIDPLLAVWINQKDLSKSFGSWTSKNRYERTLQLTRALSHEIMELEHQLEKYWKGWKKSAKEPNEHEVIMEIIDCWHFLMDITRDYLPDSQSVYEAYCAKNKENFKRIKRGY